MSKASTYQELLSREMLEWSSHRRMYFKSSSLSIREKHANQPEPPRYPRDKVLRRIFQLEMSNIMKGIIKPS